MTIISILFPPSSAANQDWSHARSSRDSYLDDESNGYSYYDYTSSALTFVHVLISSPVRSLLIAFSIFCCTSSSSQKDFVFVNRFLSKRPFVMMSRLSYAFCLTHLIPIFLRSYDVTQIRSWSVSSLVSDSIVNLFYGMILALVVHTFIEQPIVSLDRAIRQRIEHNEVTKLRSLRPSNNLAPTANFAWTVLGI